MKIMQSIILACLVSAAIVVYPAMTFGQQGQLGGNPVPVSPPFTTTPPTSHQYAIKIVCGPQGNIAPPLRSFEAGDYRAVVNVHNPGNQEDFIDKVALGAFVASGAISPFEIHNIGADATIAFDCAWFWKLSATPAGSLIDGYFVIQSKGELDVTGYYTGGTQTVGVTAMDIERVPPRTVPSIDPMCKVNNYSYVAGSNNLSPTDPHWNVAVGNNPSVPAVKVSPTPSSWAIGPPWHDWIGANTNGSGAANADYTYTLDFCSCAATNIAQVSGNAWSDNGAVGFLNPSNSSANYYPIFATPPNAPGSGPISMPGAPTGNGNFSGPPAPIGVAPYNGPYNGAGDGTITVKVHNDGFASTFPTGLSIAMNLTFANGHLGVCHMY